MHWHAYLWTGAGTDRASEAERRPSSPDFATSPLPPMRTGDWLAKPAARVAATFEEAGQATTWMAAEYTKTRDQLHPPEELPLEGRLDSALDLLPRGVDVQWGEWLQSGRFLTIGVICCPNRHVTHPCPIRRPSG
ncbi:hypothetical protein DMB42_49520 [Nonomuraea sp. WAC 01424]|uniref:hypothetical protein n=1 Tax=Nonomuraea sp. WAC 01424 TaxID=2203200 RepID=UPI000F7778E0|nr:hypothetical protein [Nonomuraea sp. WAC 01424]RSM95596.1 hypothetical protein DMB42_49520 [Nonomuraea sp. WAC 01424]